LISHHHVEEEHAQLDKESPLFIYRQPVDALDELSFASVLLATVHREASNIFAEPDQPLDDRYFNFARLTANSLERMKKFSTSSKVLTRNTRMSVTIVLDSC
jgi:hypothetical protein